MLKSRRARVIGLAAIGSLAAGPVRAAPSPFAIGPPGGGAATRALVFVHNPVRTPVPSVREFSLPPTGGRLEHTWLVVQSCVDSGRTASAGNAAAHAPRVCTPEFTARPDSTGVYSTPPRMGPGPPEAPPDAFAEASLFYHAAATLRGFRELGLEPPWPAGRPPLRLVANVRLPPEYFGGPPSREGSGLVPWGDALFIPSSRRDTGLFGLMGGGGSDTIWFGQGPVANVCYDGDVVAHEVSHAVLEPWLPRGDWRLDAYGADGAPGAIDEGLADYFAAAFSGDGFIGEYAASNAEAWQSRNIDALVRCPDALAGQRHADGLILSSALWAIRQRLGANRGPVLDRALLTALQAPRTASDLSLESLLAAILTVLEQEESGFVESVREELSRRGLFPACQRVLELNPEQSLSGMGGPFRAPGTGTLGVKELAPGLLQFHVRVPARTAAVRLRFRSPPGPFHPVVLTKRDTPLRWRYEARASSDAESSAEPEGESMRTARISVAGATGLYLQIANAGEQEGWYDGLAVSFEPEPEPVAAPAPAASPSAAIWAGMAAAGAGLGWWLWQKRRQRG